MGKPNFVIIMTDTQGADLVGCYGIPRVQTPRLDQLAEEGVRFSRAYTTCPLCAPARAALFTGNFSHMTGVFTNNLPMGDTMRTMGHRFQDKGYHTAYIGKWHLDGHDYFGTGVAPTGWDANHWYDGKNYLDELTDEEIALWRNGLNTLEELKAHNIKPEFTWAHRVSDRAINCLKEQSASDKPFVLVVSYDEPHHPYTCPPEYVERFKDYRHPLGPAANDTLEGKPSQQREWAKRKFYTPVEGGINHPLYFGCNSYTDFEIGRVIDAIDQFSAEDTYIIFTSDHGDMMGAHQLYAKGPAMYEHSTRIPFIIRGPKQVKPGRIDNTLVSHIDILPTMLELSGETIPPFLDGESIAPILLGAPSRPEKEVFMEFHRYELCHDAWGGFQPIRSIISGPLKLSINLLDDLDELYDLDKDPGELRNLINDESYAKERDRMHRSLLSQMDRVRDPFRGGCWERRPWCKEPKMEWWGKTRYKADDGYMPPVLDYMTGKPGRGAREG